MKTLETLQKQLIAAKADAYIITRNNMFLGQDILPEENKICELTGFSGSAGNLIVFRDRAVLLVDGRYDLQAKTQTDNTKIEVVCTRESIGSWIQKNIKNNCRFLYNPWCHAIAETDFWKRALDDHEFIEDKDNLLGERISSGDAEIFELEEQFSGISTEEKISYLSNFCVEQKIDAYLITECDSVSWLLNLRSNLIKNTPILRAFALVTATGEVSLFTTDFSKLEKELETYAGKSIGLAFNRAPKKLQNLMKERRIWIRNLNNPIVDWKAQKNPVEISGFKNAHIRDAVAVCRFLQWLEASWQDLDELQIVTKLREFRASQPNFYNDSFETIAGFASNGAIIHYQPTAETNKKLEADSVLLLDSGAQYFDGTTDITRTIAFASPSQEIIDSYTQVLKAHIAVASALFPKETPGMMLDAVARSVLWRYGKDYAHGTGHGVGHFLSVHEGPQSLSLKNAVPLKTNMVVSIEPGFYKEGCYGIRLENLVLIQEKIAENGQEMLGFEPLTLVPFDTKLINKKLLSSEDLQWLNTYHQQIYKTLLPHLDEKTALWLKQNTQKL